MIGTINNFVSKVVSTVSGPLYSWGPKPVKKKPKLIKTKKARCSHKGKCKCN